MVAPGPSSRPSQPLPTQAIAQVLSPAHVQGVNMMQEIILKVLAPSQERELHRRLAWEQEQEARTAQRQADLEKQLMEMRQEMSMMRAYIASMSQQQPPPQWHVAVDQPAVPLLESTARVEEMPPPSGDPHSMLQSPLTPASQTVYISPPLPAFVQGSSSRPMAMPFSPPSTSRHSPRFLPTPDTGFHSCTASRVVRATEKAHASTDWKPG
ncbi:uncharacterized protein PHACADRAFT_157429 [Phanerochaete carnosa HHB-10118-sp]|uniref:Uncharacterized protein n=1 Tax=Phanerochaete carnosa (strain HHB-10118-sp) TaxID=650164 RepID=K5V8K7_PHACS|nr:uncharacterized protein PHACADRAFT_157429 [Phanerochaete carnosa HHB-10118-sp]EKM59156.1 hypothetical protein PHACADRAFT_157429 [Phanerochaete carnosa HHB-10118-sp]